ncbi:MAG: sensor histidine kinase, partial [Halobacteriota archaeon]
GTKQYDVVVTRISNVRNRTIGRVITFHDISDYVRQQQRLKVLNRVLRHNIRTETNIIFGYADLIDDSAYDREVSMIKERAMRINENGTKGREIIDVFEHEHEPVDPLPIGRLLEECRTSIEKAYPTVDIRVGDVPDGVCVSEVLRPVFSNLVENAAEHNTDESPHVVITVQTSDESVAFTVADNGPGIDEYERTVLRCGSETPLEHGSGLGLWLVKWGVDIVGGSITFTENEPTGSVVTVEVPQCGRTERREP